MVLEKAHANIQIERMQLEDVERVAKLDILCFPTPWSESSYITELHNHAAYYIVAKDGDRIVGYAGEWIIMEEAHITTIGVDPEYRGQRIGERIFINLLDEAIHRGASRITLEVRKHNLVAQGLYRKFGFQMVAVRRGYYTNNNEDALVMWVDNMRDPAFLHTLRKYKEELYEHSGD